MPLFRLLLLAEISACPGLTGSVDEGVLEEVFEVILDGSVRDGDFESGEFLADLVCAHRHAACLQYCPNHLMSFEFLDSFVDWWFGYVCGAVVDFEVDGFGFGGVGAFAI